MAAPSPDPVAYLATAERSAGFTVSQVLEAVRNPRTGQVRKTPPATSINGNAALGLAARTLYGRLRGRIGFACGETMMSAPERAVLDAAEAVVNTHNGEPSAMAPTGRFEPAPEGANIGGHALEALACHGAVGLTMGRAILADPKTTATPEAGWAWPLAGLYPAATAAGPVAFYRGAVALYESTADESGGLLMVAPERAA